jgi:hypothetical protein
MIPTYFRYAAPSRERAGAPLAPVLIAAAGLLLFADHPPPFGPITFGAE